MDIGKVIRQIRHARKATQEEIAFAAGTDASNLSRIERGQQRYTPEMLAGIAQALGVTVSALYQQAEADHGSENNLTTSAKNEEYVPSELQFPRRLQQLNQENRQLLLEFADLLLKRQK